MSASSKVVHVDNNKNTVSAMTQLELLFFAPPPSYGKRNQRNSMERNSYKNSNHELMERNSYKNSNHGLMNKCTEGVKRRQALQKVCLRSSITDNNNGRIGSYKGRCSRIKTRPKDHNTSSYPTDKHTLHNLMRYRKRTLRLASLGRQGETAQDAQLISKRQYEDNPPDVNSCVAGHLDTENRNTTDSRGLGRSMSLPVISTAQNERQLAQVKKQRSLPSLRDADKTMARLPSLALNDEKFPLGFGSTYGVELESVAEEAEDDTQSGTSSFKSSKGRVPSEIRRRQTGHDDCRYTSSPEGEKDEHKQTQDRPVSLEVKAKSDFDYVSKILRRSDTPDIIANITRRGPRPTKDAIDETAQHNWILTREIKERFRKFEKIKEKATILLPENDPLETIEARLQEVRDMVRPQKKIYNILDSMTDKLKQHVLVCRIFVNNRYINTRRNELIDI